MAKQYKIKEMYFTLQGEGLHTGKPAVFCRFTGCNLWSGREEDRHKAICQFCDTDFVGTDGENGGRYSAIDLAKAAVELWPEEEKEDRFIVFTGGEPALQLDDLILDEIHKLGFEAAIETNGTLELPKTLDWVTLSPKANTDLAISKADEVKIVFPQAGIDPLDFEEGNYEHFFLQPMDGPMVEENTLKTIAYIKSHPKWKLSVQTHKILGIK